VGKTPLVSATERCSRHEPFGTGRSVVVWARGRAAGAHAERPRFGSGSSVVALTSICSRHATFRTHAQVRVASRESVKRLTSRCQMFTHREPTAEPRAPRGRRAASAAGPDDDDRQVPERSCREHCSRADNQGRHSHNVSSPAGPGSPPPSDSRSEVTVFPSSPTEAISLTY